MAFLPCDLAETAKTLALQHQSNQLQGHINPQTIICKGNRVSTKLSVFYTYTISYHTNFTLNTHIMITSTTQPRMHVNERINNNIHLLRNIGYAWSLLISTSSPCYTLTKSDPPNPNSNPLGHIGYARSPCLFRRALRTDWLRPIPHSDMSSPPICISQCVRKYHTPTRH